MKTKCILIIIGFLICSNSMNAQSLESNIEKNRKINPFIGAGFFPQPIYLSISGGVEIGNNNSDNPDNNAFYGTIYTRIGNFGLENTFHSYFVELSMINKKLKFKNKSFLSIEVPIWIGNRNILETFVEERHEHHDYSYLQVGSGLDLNYVVSDRLSVITKLGVGYGPQYSFAGDFNFSNYKFEQYSWLPLADIGIRFRL